jgi:hypothetical protein
VDDDIQQNDRELSLGYREAERVERVGREYGKEIVRYDEMPLVL